MKVASEIRRAIERKGFRSLREAAKAMNISTEILRLILNQGHLPKDRTLHVIARSLGLDPTALILAAHQERLPSPVKNFLLSPESTTHRDTKRKFPLSEEQCNYLCKIMTPQEIQLVRKYRQVTEEAKIAIRGYVEYKYFTKRELDQSNGVAGDFDIAAPETPSAIVLDTSRP